MTDADLRVVRRGFMALLHHVEHATVDSTPLTPEELGIDGRKRCPRECYIRDLKTKHTARWTLVRAALQRLT